MSNAALDRFGRALMGKVRDRAISDWKTILNGNLKGDRAVRIREQLAEFSDTQQQELMRLVPEVVDSVLHYLLSMLDQEHFKVAVKEGDEDIENLKDVSDGLAGELYSNRGWIARFSKEKG